MKAAICALLGVWLAVGSVAAIDSPVDLTRQARSASKVVVATVTNVESAFGQNEFGDRLIFSHVTLEVDETMKGTHEASALVLIEGGTVGEMTLAVSDMPRMVKGDRAVFFLDASPGGAYLPHARGAGLLKLDSAGRIAGTSMSLDSVRSAARAAQAVGRQ